MFGLIRKSRYDELNATFNNLSKQMNEIVEESKRLIKKNEELEKHNETLKDVLSKEICKYNDSVENNDKIINALREELDCKTAVGNTLEKKNNELKLHEDELIDRNYEQFTLIHRCFDLLSEIKEKNNSGFKYKNIKKIYNLIDKFIKEDNKENHEA